MNLFKLKPVALAIGLSTLSNIALAEIRTPKAVVGIDGTERVIASSNFASAVDGDLYVAIGVGGELLFLANNGSELTQDVSPFAENQEYIRTVSLFDFSTAGIPKGRYPVYQVVVQTGTDPLDVTNWLGGLSGLSSINFTIGLPVEVNGDFNQDGFADDDLKQDGFHDDDLNRDGFHDDDLNHDGFHDDDLNHDGLHDAIINTVALGKKLYAENCTACHGADPTQDIQNIHRAVNPDRTRSAINRNKGGMGFLTSLSDNDLQDIADYVKNQQ